MVQRGPRGEGWRRLMDVGKLGAQGLGWLRIGLEIKDTPPKTNMSP